MICEKSDALGMTECVAFMMNNLEKKANPAQNIGAVAFSATFYGARRIA